MQTLRGWVGLTMDQWARHWRSSRGQTPQGKARGLSYAMLCYAMLCTMCMGITSKSDRLAG